MSITLVSVGDVFISVLEYIHPTELKALMPYMVIAHASSTL